MRRTCHRAGPEGPGRWRGGRPTEGRDGSRWSVFLPLALLVLLAALPIHGEARPAAKIVRIGYLSPSSAAADAAQSGGIFAQRAHLRAARLVEGQNVLLEARYADSRPEPLQDLTAELVRRKVDVIVAGPTTATRAAQRATRTFRLS